jgi:TonB-linked SusC/RagA family outer membrane protein
MKKNDPKQRHRRCPALRKMLNIMKFTTLLFFMALFQVSAISYSQQTRLNLKFEKETLESVFSKIEANSEFSIFYQNELIRNSKEVSGEFKNALIFEILDQVLKTENLTYTVKNKLIMIVPKTEGTMEMNSQQQKSISGKVTDSSGSPVPGVSVVVKGTSTGVITDSDGNYSISNIPANAILQFSFVGMKGQEVAVGGKTTINVTLTEETIGIEEVVAVGYGTQKRQTITGSVASIENKQLTVVPVASTANALAGLLPGLVSLQSSGKPGYDAAALSIRGFGNALAIVDGVEANFNSIDPNEIESISILKDGAASIYGARAGNGVILVTTKRGNNEKPVITLNSSYTMQGITAMPKPVSAGQYAELASEAWLQSGQPAANVPYTPEQIQKYYAGTDPLYPNTNWYDVLVRKWAPQQQHNLSVRGGSDKIKYYGFLGYLDQGTIWKKSGGNYNRYNLQSNIDAKITDQLSLQLDLASFYEVREFPWRQNDGGGGDGGGSIWQDFWSTFPIYPASLPDPTKISFANGAGTGGAHIVSNSDISGYANSENQNIKGTVALNYNIKAVKGLSAKALVNYMQDYNSNKRFEKPVKFYTYDPASKIYTLAGALGSQATLSQSKSQNRTLTGQFSLNYDHVFAENHHVNMLFLYEAIDYSSDFVSASRINFLTPSIDQLFAGSAVGMANNGSASEMGRKSYIGRLNYSFKNKYLIESSFRADASAKFPANKRWGYFPSVSAGWILSKEGFMDGIKNLDNLKIRASYGESGNDGVGNFQYLSGYAYGGTYILGEPQRGLVSTGLANPDLTWERVKIQNVGADFSFWNRKLYGEFDAFYRERKGIPAYRYATLPSTFGAGLPPENINSLNNRGFELKIGTAGSAKDILWDVSANVSWSRAKWDHFEEPVYADSSQTRIYKRSGRWTDRAYGYVSDGLFTSQAQIDALKFDEDGQGNKSLRPGDIRYKDINDDGKFNWKDQVEIGKGTVPHWMVGFNINLKYKNFDLSTLFQGAMGYYNYIILWHAAIPPVEVYNLRWTPTNNDPNAFVPRLGGAATNGLYSDYYYKKAGYLRLKAFSVGYNLPGKWMDKMKFKQIRIYVAGTNLITFDKLKKYGTDPEAPSGLSGFYYPQQKTVSFGANLSF